MRKGIGAMVPIVCLAPISAKAQAIGEIRIIEVSDTGDPAMIRRSMMTNAKRGWVPVDDYPPAALAARRGGQVLVTVAIGADDRVTDCRDIHAIDGGEDFKQAACSILEREGLFLHALDAGGKARPGELQLEVSFRALEPIAPDPPSFHHLPPAPPFRPLPKYPAPIDDRQLELHGLPDYIGRITASLDISPEGKVIRCRIGNSSGSDAADAEACRQLGRARFISGLGQDGKPMAHVGVLVTPKILP